MSRLAFSELYLNFGFLAWLLHFNRFLNKPLRSVWWDISMPMSLTLFKILWEVAVQASWDFQKISRSSLWVAFLFLYSFFSIYLKNLWFIQNNNEFSSYFSHWRFRSTDISRNYYIACLPSFKRGRTPIFYFTLISQFLPISC